MNKIESPNYTQIPNVFLDGIMQEMTDAELRVCLAIMRNTFGWQRQSHKMSLSYLQQATGLSRQGVLNGIEAGINRGIICKEADGASYRYSLIVSANQSTKWTSQRNGLVNEVDQTSQRNGLALVNEVDQLLVNEVDTTKKGTKEKRNKKKMERKASPPADVYVSHVPSRYTRQERTAEQAHAANQHGLNAKDFRELVDAWLTATDNYELANADGPEADKALNNAKNTAITGLSLGITTPADVEKRAKAFAADHPDWSPHYGQLLKQSPVAKKDAGKRVIIAKVAA